MSASIVMMESFANCGAVNVKFPLCGHSSAVAYTISFFFVYLKLKADDFVLKFQ